MLRTLSILILSIWAVFIQAQTRFFAQIPQKAEINSELRVQFVLTGGVGEDFTPPKFTDFEILAGPGVSSFTGSYTQGRRSISQTSTTYTYLLRPKRKGTLTIGAATVHLNGKVLQSTPTTVHVSGNAQSNDTHTGTSSQSAPTSANMQKAGSKIRPNDLYCTADLSKKVVYEQEAVMLTYRYHARNDVQPEHITLTQKPDLKGCWNQEVSQSPNIHPQAVTIGGKMYVVGSPLQYLLFPQQPGMLSIAPATFICDVPQQDDTMDEIDAFFNGGNITFKKVEITSAAIQLRVLPLPLPKPQHFSGGVGQFRITAELVSPHLRTNDIGTLRITVTGTGNLKLIQPPKVFFPKEFEKYPPKVTDSVRITAEGVTGNMQFDHTFVPKKVGDYTISPIELVYFDPNSKRYVTTKTTPIALHILKGEKSLEETNAELELRSSDILPIQAGTHTAYRHSAWNHFGTWPFFVLFLCLVGSFNFIYVGLRKYLALHRNTTELRQGKAAQMAFKALEKLEKSSKLSPKNSLTAELKSILLQYFADKLRYDRSTLTHQFLQEQLYAAGYQEELRKQTETLLRQIDFLEFAPGTSATDASTMLNEIKSLITAIEKSSH